LGTGKVRRRIPVADTPRGLWPSEDGKTLWVASFGTGELQRVNLRSGKVTTVFSGGGALRHLVADEQRHKLYASDMAKNCVWVTNMRTGKTTKFADVDQKPNTIDLSPNGNVLLVSCRGANNPVSYYLPGPEWGSILLFGTPDGKPLDAIVGGNQCTALDMSTTGRILAFSDFLDNRLRFYSVPPHEVLKQGGGGRFGVYKAELDKK
jgi:streptogramin lyase